MVGVGNLFAIGGYQKYMKGIDVFNLGFDGEIFVVNLYGVANAKRKKEK